MVRNVIGVLFFLLLAIVFSPNVYAQCVAGTPCIASDYTPGNGDNDMRTDEAACDGDFMNQIYARAFLEAERENVLAQTYIRKPDSVMEYSCLDSMIGLLRPHAVELFSSSDLWRNKTVQLNIAYTAAGNPTSIPMTTSLGALHVSSRINQVVGNALGTFVNSNFNHDFLGGTAGIGSSIGNTIPNGAYSCAVMRTVWDLAKCQNFEDASATFWTFDELAAGDPRQFPDPAACVTDVTPELIEVARNPMSMSSPTATPPATPPPAAPTYPAAIFDALDPHLDLLLPATSDADCQAPVPTGLDVVLYNFTLGAPTAANPSGIDPQSAIIPEMVCINPGCYYHVDVDWAPTPTGTGPLQLCPNGFLAIGTPPTCPPYASPGECRDG